MSTNFDSSSSTEPVDKCVHCSARNCALRRCSRCRTVQYCSIPCQRRHWKRSHRILCNAIGGAGSFEAEKEGVNNGDGNDDKRSSGTDVEARTALNSLFKEVCSMSAEEAHYRLQDALEEMERLKQELKENDVEERKIALLRLRESFHQKQRLQETKQRIKSFTGRDRNENYSKQIRQAKIEFDSQSRGVDEGCEQSALSDSEIANTCDLEELITYLPAQTHFCQQLVDDDYHFTSSTWQYAVENLHHLSCYNILVTPADVSYDEAKNEPDYMEILSAMSPLKRNNLELILSYSNQGLEDQVDPCIYLVDNTQKHVLLSLSLKGRIVVPAKEPDEANVVQFRNSPIIKAHQSCIGIERDCIILRLPYDPSTFEGEIESLCNDECLRSTSDISQVNSMACGACGHSLLEGRNINGDGASSNIRQLLPLPTGFWDEIAEYLICFEGDPTVHFTSSSTRAVSNCALEDSIVFVLHRENVENGVVVLPIDGYGKARISNKTTRETTDIIKDDENQQEDEKRGQDNSSAFITIDREWSDKVGGATACCKNCKHILGYVSLEDLDTFRLYKHRLASRGGFDERLARVGQFGLDTTKINTCSSFLATEMVRYAESKAIFCFRIHQNDSDALLAKTVEFISIHLVQWESSTALCSSQKNTQDVVHLPFGKFVKLIFQKVSKMANEAKERSDILFKQSSAPFSFLDSNFDFCCPPGSQSRHHKGGTVDKVAKDDHNNNTTADRFFNIYLSQEEWAEILTSLQSNARFFPTSISVATVAAKLGDINGPKPKLSALSLL